VESVTATALVTGALETDVEDCVSANLIFHSGALATVHLDFLERPASHFLQVTGDSGVARWSMEDGMVRSRTLDQEEWQTVAPPDGHTRNHLFLEEMRAYLDCLRDDKDPPIGIDDGVAALRIALAALRSGEQGRVVRVEEL
jgi:predicted dehydrogenase